MKIVAMGDVHADWKSLFEYVEEFKPDIVLQCGDFGYWPKYNTKLIKKAEAGDFGDTKILFCDGNHEHHRDLKQTLGDRQNVSIAPGVIYMPRMSTYKLPDGRTVLFVGGAESVDKYQRTEGFNWFKEEIISPSEGDMLMDKLLKIDVKIDIVISHTCPMEIEMCSNTAKITDPTRKFLSEVRERLRPDLWYFGHWHFPATGVIDNTHWTALNYSYRNTGQKKEDRKKWMRRIQEWVQEVPEG